MRELGLWSSAARGLGFSLLLTLPALITLVFYGHLNPDLKATRLLVTGCASPLSEEILFRGYLFRQLYRRAHWPFVAALLMNAATFAWDHLYQTEGFSFVWIVGVLLVSVVLATLASWLFLRWDENLWFVIGIHAFMNLWWELFASGDIPLYGWVGHTVRFGTAAIIVAVTLYKDRIWTASPYPSGNRSS